MSRWTTGSLAMLFWMGVLVSSRASVFAQEEPSTLQQGGEQRPEIAITTAVEDDRKLVLATVTLDGKELEGVKVAFFVRRTFGLLPLGTEETLDDGTSAVPFPLVLPGGPTGKLQVIAEIKASEEFAAAHAEATLEAESDANGMGGGPMLASAYSKHSLASQLLGANESDPFPRAVWAPKAPLPLLVTIATLVGGVWCAYAYVFVQLVRIRKGAKS